MKTLVFELNEFSLPLLDEGAKKLNLSHLQKLLSFHRSETHTDDTYENDLLEPWVQWVSIHTGIPSQEHRVKHLGDIPGLNTPQIWETLSDHGISTGIWGAMNAGRNGAEHCSFFLPDPWSFSEVGHPETLNALLFPLRYTSKNYGEKKWGPLFQEMKGLLLFLKREKQLGFFLKKIPALLKNTVKYRGKPFLFISLLDQISTKLFLGYQKQYHPQVSFLFLNSIAHLMHHQWKRPITKNSPLGHGLICLDGMIKELLTYFDEKKDLIILTNGLSQISTENDPPWVLHRQIDQVKFLKAVGIKQVQVESHMTHDAHLFFETEKEAQEAKELLLSAKIANEKLFQVESYENDPKKLFYKIIFTKPLEKGAVFRIGAQEHPFFDLFISIIQRTGKHIQTGNLLSNQKIFPEKLYNHEIRKHLEKIYIKRAPTK